MTARWAALLSATAASVALLGVAPAATPETPPAAGDEDPPDPKIEVRLLRDAPHGALALTFDIEPGWHIYWSNPGDTGLATSAALTPPLAPARFPGPERFTDPDTEFVTYGYAGRAALFFDGPTEGGASPVADAAWLACRERHPRRRPVRAVPPVVAGRAADGLPQHRHGRRTGHPSGPPRRRPRGTETARRDLRPVRAPAPHADPGVIPCV